MRIVRASHADLRMLAAFTCAHEAWYQQEVEDFIQRDLARRATSGATALLAKEDGEVIAVAAHEPMSEPSGTGLTVTYLTVIAVANRSAGNEACQWRAHC